MVASINARKGLNNKLFRTSGIEMSAFVARTSPQVCPSPVLPMYADGAMLRLAPAGQSSPTQISARTDDASDTQVGGPSTSRVYARPQNHAESELDVSNLNDRDDTK